MTLHDDSIQAQPAKRPASGLPDPLPESKALQESPGEHPDQPGSEFGGYGHADSSFGRNPGSSSEQGGQGASNDTAPGTQASPETPRGSSSGASQTRHASPVEGSATQPQDSTATADANRKGGYRYGKPNDGLAAEERNSPTPLAQGGATPPAVPAPGR